MCVCVCGGGILSQFTHIKLDFYILNKTCKTRLTLCGPCPSILKSKESQIRNHTESLNLHPLYHLSNSSLVTSIMSHDCVFNIRFFRLSLLFSFICVCVYIYDILSQFTRIKLDLYILNKTCKTRFTLCGPCPSILESKESQIRD